MKKLIYKAAVWAIIPTVLFTTGCKEKAVAPLQEGVNGMKYAIMVTGGTWPSQTSYFSGSKEFPTGTVGTQTAAELSGSGMMYHYGKYCYISTFGAPATLRKYSFDAEGTPIQISSFVVQGLKTFGAIDFISETEAYAASNGFGGIPKVVKFNPSTMAILSTIDVTPIQKTGATNVFYLGITHRDNYIFMGVNYQKGFSNLADSVYVAVINRTTGKVEKVIADGRTSVIWAGASEYGYSANALVIDENKDIYVTGTGNGGTVPSGVVKIKNGETEFDLSYFFNLKTATGLDCFGLFYYGNGKALTLRSEDPNNYPFDGDSTGYRFYKINLINKTSQGDLSSTLPKVFTNAFATKWDNEKLYLGIPANNANSIYSFGISSGIIQKEFDLSAGNCNGFAKLQ